MKRAFDTEAQRPRVKHRETIRTLFGFSLCLPPRLRKWGRAFDTEAQRHRVKLRENIGILFGFPLCLPPRLCVSVSKGIFLLALTLGVSHATTFYLTLSGLGGEPDYVQRFKMLAEDIDSSLKKAGGDSNVITLVAPTREQVRSSFAQLDREAKPADSLVLMLIGHGSYDGSEYKFNIPGPDLSGAELASLLDHVPAQRQLVVNMTSSSGGSIEFLRKPNRVVITATKSGTEKNATIFARYWAEALRDPAADKDKNESISALEAFFFAQQKTTEFFDTQKRLATEHAVLEDTGKGEGEKTPSPENGEGRLAGSFTVVRLGSNAAAAQDPAKRALLDQKEQLEQSIDKLKYNKAAIPEAQYKQQLTQLLLDLAKVQEAIDQ